jgi:predicted small lipoprotein YifL
MFKATQILVSLIALGACLFNTAGCGQTGPLYLPSAPPASSTK